MLNRPALLLPEKNNSMAEELYQRVYDLFLSGRYEEALALKEKADCDFGDHYWTPQLLYIWAIYCTQCTNDHEAISILTNIVNNYPTSPLKQKALTLISVLNRRKEIVKYLTTLQITRTPDGNLIVIPEEPSPVVTKPQDSTVKPKPIPVSTIPAPKIDSVVATAPTFENGVYKWFPNKQHYVVMLLNNIDDIYVNESRNAFNRFNRQYNFTSISIGKENIEPQKSMLIFSVFDNADGALVYAERLKKAAPSEVSWLQPSKYSFILINEDNLKLLKSTKDINSYKKILNDVYPGKF
jgi:hypothetical protein